MRDNREQGIDYPRVVLLSVGHFTNDVYGSLMSSLTPYLIVRGAVSATAAGFILLVYLLGSSVLQPLFGLVSDRSGRRAFAIVGPIWVGVAAAAFARATGAIQLLAIAAIGGIGTAAFHPQAATMVNGLSARSKGWAMSIFSMGGNLGFALGPVLAATLATVGFGWSPIVLAPGTLVCVLLGLFSPIPLAPARHADLREIGHSFARAGWALACVVAVIAIRSGTQFGLIVFLPLYYHARGFPVELGSYYAFVVSLFGALGGLLGGTLSDRWGRTRVIVLSLALSTPLLYLSLLASGPAVWPLLALSGATLIASNSVTVVQGQELLPGSTGIASGLTLGLGFGLSGVISSALTSLSDHIGLHSTVFLIPALPLAAALLGALIPVAAGGGRLLRRTGELPVARAAE